MTKRYLWSGLDLLKTLKFLVIYSNFLNKGNNYFKISYSSWCSILFISRNKSSNSVIKVKTLHNDVTIFRMLIISWNNSSIFWNSNSRFLCQLYIFTYIISSNHSDHDSWFFTLLNSFRDSNSKRIFDSGYCIKG